MTRQHGPSRGRAAVWRVGVACALAVIATMLMLGGPRPTHAADAPPVAQDPALEARLQRIAVELRCLVCQNQTIADSNADLAVDLRRQVREMLKKGATDAEVYDYMTARYGDFVLYRPRFGGYTLWLWLAPFVLLVVGLVVLARTLKRRAALPDDAFEPDEAKGEFDGAPALRQERGP